MRDRRRIGEVDPHTTDLDGLVEFIATSGEGNAA